MPCDYHLGNEYRCDLGFSEAELERHRCPLHFRGDEASAVSDARTATVQKAIDAIVARQAKKNAALNLFGVVVPRNVRFSNLTIRDCVIRGSTFGGGDLFTDVTFEGNVQIDDSRFLDTTRIVGGSFKKSLLMRCDVHGWEFENVAFHGKTNLRLSATDANRTVGLKKVICEEEFTIVPTTEHLSIFEIKDSECKKTVYIEGAFRNEFKLSNSLFRGAFSATARFIRSFQAKECQFDEKAAFSRTKFLGVVRIEDSSFQKAVNFATLFANHAQFKGCLFEQRADFSVPIGSDEGGDLFHGVDFTDTVFAQEVMFTNRRFLSTTNFEGCEFHVAPEFHGASFHQDTRFPKIDAFRQISSGNAAAAYRTLRQAMEKNNARREEAMFYALEQKTLRRIPGAQSTWENFASASYDAMTGYGVNFWRPLGGLFAMAAFFGVGYALWLSSPIPEGADFDAQRLGQGLVFSVQQVVNPFWIWRLPDNELWSDYPSLLRIIATIESLITTGLLALSLLALRWRFKRE